MSLKALKLLNTNLRFDSVMVKAVNAHSNFVRVELTVCNYSGVVTLIMAANVFYIMSPLHAVIK